METVIYRSGRLPGWESVAKVSHVLYADAMMAVGLCTTPVTGLRKCPPHQLFVLLGSSIVCSTKPPLTSQLEAQSTYSLPDGTELQVYLNGFVRIDWRDAKGNTLSAKHGSKDGWKLVYEGIDDEDNPLLAALRQVMAVLRKEAPSSGTTFAHTSLAEA